MSATSITLAGRVAAERNMVDTCTISRITGQLSDTQDGHVSDLSVEVYSGKCRVQQMRGRSRPTTVAAAYVFQTLYELQLPMSSTDILINDVVTIDSSALDPDLASRTFWVRETAAKTHATARRVGIEEVGG